MDTMQSRLKRPSLSDEAISNLVDPRTRQRLRPLGVVGGRTVWPMMGASPDDPSEREQGDPSNEGDDPEGGTREQGGDGSDKGDPAAKIAALEEEKNRHVRRRQETEQELEEARKRLAEIEGKDKTELEKATTRVTALESENSALQESLNQARLENAFLTDNSYKWHNPRRALSLADLSDVEIDSDGTVHGLKKALDALAKSDAYLLVKDDEGGSEEERRSTGDQKNSSKRKKDADADDAALAQKYPALRR